ncbi:ABC transporter ATP-binding protein [Fluviispira multicolorata]|uniref:ATP-binding cassette domain-containing protein n=1 Tax=Fluviispira multicolorata TaxID=2654512 RepID=A0A833N1X9_9BACT|nr:ABC transporter ATP-binding protein [Fluviispira multicolorata]KAB8031837.1 ATP-binding cassette domain-containing protein [Fluviispira multicolorata]
MLLVENLSVNYGAIQALKSVNFEIFQGEIVSLVGSNGAGKTTFLRTLSGLVKAKSGKIFFSKSNISNIESHEIVKLGISQSPEGRMVFPDMTVKENLFMGAFCTKNSSQEIQKDIDKMIDWFPRLGERMNQKSILLSGGEQQMLAIARALMARPKLLLLDEPSLGIAPLVVQQIFKIISELNRGGMTILLAEQNARLALKISHRAYVLELGTVIKKGEAQSLLHDDDVQRAYLGG